MKEYQQEPKIMSRSMKHWFEKEGFRPEKRCRRWRDYFFAGTKKAWLIEGTLDRRRHVRVLAHLNRMDICDGYFDRWANSTAASVPMPRNEKEFDAALRELVRLSAARVSTITANMTIERG